MSVNSPISHPRLTRGSYTSYFTLQISNTYVLETSAFPLARDVTIHKNVAPRRTRARGSRRVVAAHLCAHEWN